MTSSELVARADLSALLPKYDSAGERWWATYGPLLIAGDAHQPVALTLAHPLAFAVPGGRYTPDFLHILQDGRLVLVEIKGSKRQPNYRDARSKLRAAAELYPWAAWVEARVDGRGACEIEWLREVTCCAS